MVGVVKTTKLEAEKKKKRKRKTSTPPSVRTPVIPTPLTKDVDSDDEEEEEDGATDYPPVIEEQTVRRSLSPAAKRQRELAQKTTEHALCQGLEAQRAAAATQVKMPVLIRLWTFRTKPRVPTIVR
jgi:hypothetical protein